MVSKNGPSDTHNPPNAATVLVAADTKAKISAIAFVLQRPEWSIIEDALDASLVKLDSRDVSLITELAARIRNHTNPIQDGTGVGRRDSDRVRHHVAEHIVKPARERGEDKVDVAVGAVHRDLGLSQRHPLVISALKARVFAELCNVRLIALKGPKLSSTTVLTFELL